MASIAVLVLLLVWGGAAVAQRAESRTVTVGDRKRPELDPLGVRLGAFMLFPTVGVQEIYDDNLFATSDEDVVNGKQSDFITILASDFRMHTTWSRHRMNLFGGVDAGLHLDNSTEDYIDWRLGAEGRLDILRSSHVSGGLTFRKQHDERGSVNDPSAIEPVTYTRWTPRLGYLRRWSRLSLKLDGQTDSYDYLEGVKIDGLEATNDLRDRLEYSGVARLGFELSPEFETFVRVKYNLIEYDAAVNSGSVNRDSNGYRIVAGARLDLTGVIFGDLFAGLVVQNYDDASLADVSETAYGVRLTWNMTRMTTVIVKADRIVSETTIAGAGASFDTTVGATVDHELMRNMIVTVNASHQNSDFVGEASGREDKLIAVGISGKYLLNRSVYFTFGYDRSERDSSAALSDFVINKYMARFRFQL